MLSFSELSRVPEVSQVSFDLSGSSPFRPSDAVFRIITNWSPTRKRKREHIERSREIIVEVRAGNRENYNGLVKPIYVIQCWRVIFPVHFPSFVPIHRRPRHGNFKKWYVLYRITHPGSIPLLFSSDRDKAELHRSALLSMSSRSYGLRFDL